MVVGPHSHSPETVGVSENLAHLVGAEAVRSTGPTGSTGSGELARTLISAHQRGTTSRTGTWSRAEVGAHRLPAATVQSWTPIGLRPAARLALEPALKFGRG